MLCRQKNSKNCKKNKGMPVRLKENLREVIQRALVILTDLVKDSLHIHCRLKPTTLKLHYGLQNRSPNYTQVVLHLRFLQELLIKI
jgi:hypothetical protein